MDKKIKLGLELTPLHSENRSRSAGRVAQLYFEGFSRLQSVDLTPYARTEFPVDSVLANGTWWDKLFGHWRLAWEFHRSRPDLIQIVDPMKIPRIKPAPVVTLVHNLVPYIYRDRYQPNLFVRYLYRRMKQQLKSSTGLITPSRKTAADLEMMFSIPPRQIRTIYHGIDLTRFYPRPEEQIAATTARHGIKQPYFLMVADMSTYDPHKGLETVTNRWKSKYLKGTELAIVGRPGAYSTRLKKSWPGEPGQLIFPGFVDDDELAALYSGACGLIYPSRADGFSFPVLEAMACGTRPVVRFTGAVKELVDERTVKIDDNLFEDELIPALRSLLHNRGCDENVAKHAQKFDRQKTVEQLKRYYSELL